MKNEKEEQIIDSYKNQDVEHGTYGLRLSPLSMKWRLPTVGLGRPSGPPISTLVLGGRNIRSPPAMSFNMAGPSNSCMSSGFVSGTRNELRGRIVECRIIDKVY